MKRYKIFIFNLILALIILFIIYNIYLNNNLNYKSYEHNKKYRNINLKKEDNNIININNLDIQKIKDIKIQNNISKITNCEKIIGYEHIINYDNYISLCIENITFSKFYCYYNTNTVNDKYFCVISDAIWIDNKINLINCTIDINILNNIGRELMYGTGLPNVFNKTINIKNTLLNKYIHNDFYNNYVFFQIPDSKEKPGNLGHEFAGLYSIFLTRRILNLDDTNVDTHIFNFDTNFYNDIWNVYGIFSNNSVKTSKDIKNNSYFEKIIFPIAPGDSPFWDIHWTYFNCPEIQLLKSFSNRILNYYNLDYIKEPDRPSIIWVSRNDVGNRIIPYFDEIYNWLLPYIDKKIIKFKMIEYGKLKFYSQIKETRTSNIMIAPNGSGMMHSIFLPDKSIVLEVQWNGGCPQQFENIAKLSGKLHIKIIAKYPLLTYDTGRNQKYINITLNQLKSSIKNAIGIASGFNVNNGILEI